jgi:hypothetical protein
MSTSFQYRETKNQITRLHKHLLPNKFDPTGCYTDRQNTRVLAYRVLVHAEIETYLEERVWAIGLDAVNLWKNNREMKKTLLSLLAFSGRVMEYPPNTLTPKKGSKVIEPEKVSLDKKIDIAINDFRRVIQTNHGVKEVNLLALLLPIGIDIYDLDEAWISSMSAFGEGRGQVAHKSSRVINLLDPQTEAQNIRQLMAGLKDLDDMLNCLL